MLSVATAASAIRDSFSRNNSDSDQSKDDTNDSSQKQSVTRDKVDLLGNTKLDETTGNSFLTPPSITTTPREENKQLKYNVDVDSSTSWQENLTGTAEPTTNLDTTQVEFQPSSSPSNSVTSLKIEHFGELEDELTTPIAGDISSQIPSTSLNDKNDTLSNNNNDSSTSRKSFRLPTKSNSAKPSKQKKRSRGPSGSIIDEASVMDSPPLGSYAPAAPRRNAEFHALFRSVPEEDYLINDFGCALQKEILVQGRLYVSENHVCFNANIFGWVTNLVIAFSDIVSIEKRMTAFVIPNAIQISTLHARHFFTTFLSRDSVYDLLYSLWKQIHPSLTMTESEYVTSQKGSDASESSEENFLSSDDEGKSTVSQGPRKRFALPKLTLDPMRLMRGYSNSTSSSDDDNTLNQEKLDNIQSLPPSPKRRGFDNSNVVKEKKTYRSRSKSNDGLQLHDADIADSKRSENFQNSLSPRNQTRHIISNVVKKRRPTQCDCLKKGQHYENLSLDAKFTGSVEKIFNLLFTSDFQNRFHTEEEKCTDLEVGEWNTESSNWTRSMSYIKPLNNAIGPKSTKCCIEEECQHRDFDNYVTCLSKTITPDVPSGNSFCLKYRTCIMWAGANESRVVITCSVEWSKSSWLKGTIERACIDGHQTHWKELAQAIKKYISAHSSEFKDEQRAQGTQEETIDSEEVGEKAVFKRSHTRPKDRIRSAKTKAEVLDLQENEPVTAVQRHQDIWSLMINTITSLPGSLIQSITAPSTNTIILLILLMLVINNFNNWLTLRSIGNKLDSLDGRRDDDMFIRPRGYREYTPLFDERIEKEGDDPLWQWLQERSKMYDKFGRNPRTNPAPTSSKDHTRPSESEFSSSHQIHSDDSSNSRPISSQDLYEQIGDLYRLIQVAEGHVKKLVDVAEFESYYYKDSEDNTSKQHYDNLL